MKFCIFLAAFGKPYIKEKKEILIKNLIKIYKNIKIKFDLFINCYDDKFKFDFLKKLNILNNIYIFRKKGILAELWFQNKYIYLTKNYDYLLFTLDDVLFKKMDINKMINILNNHKIKFLSPSIENSTWKCMNKLLKSNNVLAFTNICEIYTLLMKADDFKLFLSLHDYENKWLWGVDYIFDYYNIRTAVHYDNICIHKFKANHDSKSFNYKINNMNKYFKKNNIPINNIKKKFKNDLLIKSFKYIN